ncbi:hypothetical protein KW791_03715 [Candidatus Parcubacteria bacterium]|nr:hypothetical protein [Candidatus Parcubacteria bacterium]
MKNYILLALAIILVVATPSVILKLMQDHEVKQGNVSLVAGTYITYGYDPDTDKCFIFKGVAFIETQCTPKVMEKIRKDQSKSQLSGELGGVK